MWQAVVITLNILPGLVVAFRRIYSLTYRLFPYFFIYLSYFSIYLLIYFYKRQFKGEKEEFTSIIFKFEYRGQERFIIAVNRRVISTKNALSFTNYRGCWQRGSTRT